MLISYLKTCYAQFMAFVLNGLGVVQLRKRRRNVLEELVLLP